MKKFTKLLGIVLIMALVMSISVSAFAATHTVTINPADGDTATHTYGAYQIFAGKTSSLSNKDNEIEEITFGAAVTGKEADFISALKAMGTAASSTAFNGLTDTSTAAQVAGAIYDYAANGKDDAAAQNVAATIGKFIADNNISATTTAAKTFENLEEGYYFFKDESNPDDGNAATDAYGASTRFILDVVKDFEITAKTSVPQVEKKVDDRVDSSNSENAVNWADDADYDVGDIVPYKITGTVSSTFADYTKYSYKFIDSMSTGLEYFTDPNHVTKVYMFASKTAADAALDGTETGATDVTGHFTITGSGQSLTVEAKDTNGLKDIQGATGTSAFVVFYYAKVTDQAVMGKTGNPNEVYLEFSNNPNAGGEGEKGTTPKDTAIVFTYNVVVNKVEKDTSTGAAENATKPLTGADFKLFKKYTTANATAAGKTEATMPTKGITEAEWTLDDGYIWVEVTGKKSDATDGTKDAVFTYNRIDDGDYLLVETVTPAGYNTIAPQKFTVSATHAKGALTALTGTPATGAVITMSPTLSETDAKLSTDVLNNSGTVLPSTGGIGTTIFYVVGSILVVAAGVLLITKKRMGRE